MYRYPYAKLRVENTWFLPKYQVCRQLWEGDTRPSWSLHSPTL